MRGDYAGLLRRRKLRGRGRSKGVGLAMVQLSEIMMRRRDEARL